MCPPPCFVGPGLGYTVSHTTQHSSVEREKNGKPQRLLSLLTTLAFLFAYSCVPMLWYNSNPCAPLKGKQFPGLVVGLNTNPLGSIHSLAHLQWRPLWDDTNSPAKTYCFPKGLCISSLVALNECAFTLVKVIKPGTSCYRNTISEMSLKCGADPTGACTQNATRVEEKVSQMKHIVTGRKQWTRKGHQSPKKSTRIQHRGANA